MGHDLASKHPILYTEKLAQLLGTRGLVPMIFFNAESRYNTWVNDHYRFLLRSAWALTGSRAMAEDVVQDCFASAWRFKEQLKRNDSVRAWLFQIMRRNAYRHLRRVPISLDDSNLLEQAAPDAALDDKLDVVKSLARIAPIHREVLVLYYFDDMPTTEMAMALEIAPGTVMSRLARARSALKAAMLSAHKTEQNAHQPSHQNNRRKV